MANGMFTKDEEDEDVVNTEAGGQRDRYGDIIRGVYTGPDTVVFPGQVDYGTIPSDLIRDEIAETQLFRDFISKFGDKLEGKGQAAANWLEALVKYGSGDATLKDMQEVDVSGLMDVEGFEDYYNDIVIVQTPQTWEGIEKILRDNGYSSSEIESVRESVGCLHPTYSVVNGKNVIDGYKLSCRENERFKGSVVLPGILRDLGYEGGDWWDKAPKQPAGTECFNNDGPGTIGNDGQCKTNTTEGTECYETVNGQSVKGKRDANGKCVLPDDETQDGDDGTEDTTFSEEARKVSQAIKDWIEGQIGQVKDMTVEDVLETVFGGNGYDPKCELTGEGEEMWDCTGTDGTEGNQCWKDCVSIGVLGGIPGLPMPPGNIDVGTVRDLEDKVKEIGGTISDIFSAPQGDADDKGFIQRAKDWVLGKIDDIFGGIDDVTPGQITDWITGVLGTTISGVILQEIEGKKNSVIDKINEITGLPLDTATTLINCADYGREGGEVGSVDECGNCLDKTEDIGTDGRCRKFIKDDFDVSEVETTCKREGKEYNDLLDECGDCIQDGYVPGADGVCGPIDGDVDTEVDPRCSNPAFAARNPSLCGGQTTYTEGPGFGKTKCQDRYAENYDQFGECGDCIEGYSRKTEGANCTKDETTGTVDGGGDTTVVEDDTCDDPSANNYGEAGDCTYDPIVETCDDPSANNYGKEGPCTYGPTVTKCEDPNALNTGQDGPCRYSPSDPCLSADYAAANPQECGTGPECNDCTCAEYAAANPDECGTAPPPETPSGGTGGTGGTSGASGMFDLESFEITGDPQLLAKMEFPITDFLSGMFKDYV